VEIHAQTIDLGAWRVASLTIRTNVLTVAMNRASNRSDRDVRRVNVVIEGIELDARRAYVDIF
jgi:hypothetical protein